MHTCSKLPTYSFCLTNTSQQPSRAERSFSSWPFSFLPVHAVRCHSVNSRDLLLSLRFSSSFSCLPQNLHRHLLITFPLLLKGKKKDSTHQPKKQSLRIICGIFATSFPFNLLFFLGPSSSTGEARLSQQSAPLFLQEFELIVLISQTPQ